MAKSVALGFGAAGAVVAAAVIAVAGATVGFEGTDGARAGATSTVVSSEFAPADIGSLTAAGDVVSCEVVTTASGEQIEYVYVDAPATRGYDDDDGDHEDDDHDDDGDDHEEREHDREDEDD